MSPNPWSAPRPVATPRRPWWPFRRLRWEECQTRMADGIVQIHPLLWRLTDGTRTLAYLTDPGHPDGQWRWTTEGCDLNYINRGDCESRELAMQLAEAAVRWELRQPRREP